MAAAYRVRVHGRQRLFCAPERRAAGAGEQLSGFRVETIERLDTPGGKTAYLTHEATGAAVVYIEDTGASPALTLMARTTDGCAA